MSIGGPSKVGFIGDFIGDYRIKLTVSRLGVVGSYRVALFLRREQIPIRTQFSSLDGDCYFDWIKNIEKGYFAVAFDHTDGDLRNAAIADTITPVAMSIGSGSDSALDIGAGSSGGTAKTVGYPF